MEVKYKFNYRKGLILVNKKNNLWSGKKCKQNYMILLQKKTLISVEDVSNGYKQT